MILDIPSSNGCIAIEVIHLTQTKSYTNRKNLALPSIQASLIQNIATIQKEDCIDNLTSGVS